MNKNNSKYYHGKKGCLNVLKRKEPVGDKHFILIYTCLTHNVDTCHCGWEHGKHYIYE